LLFLYISLSTCHKIVILTIVNFGCSCMEARSIVRILKQDRGALKELAEEIVSIEDIRLAIINAVLKDVATKDDLKELKDEMKEYINIRIEGVEKHIKLLAGFMMATFVGIVLTLIAILLK